MKVANKSAYFDYDLGERVEAGIVLSGAEAKSAHKGAVDMGHAYARIREFSNSLANGIPLRGDKFQEPNKSKIQNQKSKRGKEVWIIGLHIYPYEHANNEGYDPERTRKLLLHQREILALEAKMKSSGRTLVPTAMYTKSGRIKVELALARGKKKFEKREKIKKRDVQRDLERSRG